MVVLRSPEISGELLLERFDHLPSRLKRILLHPSYVEAAALQSGKVSRVNIERTLAALERFRKAREARP